MMNAQANDSGWPTFSGKYVEYPRFRKEWWAYRQTYHGHVRDELVCRSLKERSLASHVRLLVNDIDDLREKKLITDNRLCPFCLLHDKDKQCGAKQKPASVACTASGCKGRHAQKLHDLLKDIFREEGQVHVLQEDDGWEESEEAWELEEAEGMIVGAVRQAEGFSWQDACEAWEAQGGEMRASIHQVKADGVGKDGPEEVDVHEQSEAESDGLLVEGDEREYILELLLREAPSDAEAGVHPARAEPVTLTGKKEEEPWEEAP
jgi:hypothetical protein